MWQTKYASAVPKNLGVGVDFRPCSEGDFLTAVRKLLGVRSPWLQVNSESFHWSFWKKSHLFGRNLFQKEFPSKETSLKKLFEGNLFGRNLFEINLFKRNFFEIATKKLCDCDFSVKQVISHSTPDYEAKIFVLLHI